ncbi:TonB-dependent receptor [Microbulbifer celer]|uniref:TonB-dependent receptor n=1 Tax=Microbulbifer celer TaxID=435905 RepID=A0ABW3UA10_9GAMM|nr:TonB-dependent receptor [Microbulbifer celer]UFN57475.1 TonB-dependent receptor [Microbulbifer celer]
MSIRNISGGNALLLKKNSLLAVAIAAVIGGSGASAEEMLEEVVVEGFRGTLVKSRDLKRDAVGTQDSIVAEDIAEFPDLNLAESLQRIPGVTITRDGGEGRRIAVRGLDSNFALVQLNGMDVLGNTDTAMDSRSQGSRDRAFDFNLFASELFSQVDVKKSYSASQDEGGLAGNVGLRTAKPFDYEGFNLAVSGQLGSNELTEDASPRTAMLISNTWENFGALASAAYSSRDTLEQGVNTYRWRRRADDNGAASIYGPAVTAEEEAAMRNGEVLAPRAVGRLSAWFNDQERLGLTTAFQFRADTFDLTLDMLYGELNSVRDEYHLNPRGNEGSMAYGAGVTTNDVTIVDGVLLAGDYTDTGINVESRDHQVDTEFSQVVLSGNWYLSDRLTLRGLVGNETSDLDVDSLKVFTETRGDFSFDYTRDIMEPVIAYGQDMTDASQYWLEELDIFGSVNETENSTVKFDLDYTPNDTDLVRAGVSFKALENRTIREDRNDILNDYDNGRDYADLLDDSFFRTMSGNEAGTWAVVDAYAVLNSDLVSRLNSEGDNDPLAVSVDIGDSTDRVREETSSLYVEYEWDRQLGALPFRGNIGLRYYETDTASDYSQNDQLLTLERTYDGLLPAVNLVVQPSDDTYVRFGWSRNVTRPSYGDLSGAPQVNTDSGSLEVSGTNPTLEPYESDNLDVSYEWYFTDAGYMAIGYYRKDLDGYIVQQTEMMPFAETGVSTSLLPEDYTLDSQARVTRAVNSESATLQGIEFTLQRDFDFLPAPFNQMGIVGSYTRADGEVNNYAGGEQLSTTDFPNLSKNAGNITLYYETDVWGTRLSQSYRSDYIQNASDGNDEDYRGFLASTFWDLSAFYNVNDRLKLTLEGSNLTDEQDRQYSSKDAVKRLYNVTNSGRTVYLGVSYQF